MMRRFFSSSALILIGGLGLGLGAGCYGVEFDEEASDAYYCQTDSDCGPTQSCAQFRCVDDTGPALRLTGPEPLTPFEPSTTSIDVVFDASGLNLVESNDRVEGDGRVAISLDGEELAIADTDVLSLALPSDIAPGAHQLSVQAVYGTGEAYTNPSSSDFVTFYITDGIRPQVAVVEPGHGHVHVAGEPLNVAAAVRNFTYVENGTDCFWAEDCDPFAEGAVCEQSGEMCTADGEPSEDGHSHAYLDVEGDDDDDYPGCLLSATTPCNLRYALSMRLSDNIEGDADEVSGVIPGDRFDEPGPVTLSISLQYNNHDTYPNEAFVIYDQVTIEVIER